MTRTTAARTKNHRRQEEEVVMVVGVAFCISQVPHNRDSIVLRQKRVVKREREQLDQRSNRRRGLLFVVCCWSEQ
jgi:hypothetical protein